MAVIAELKPPEIVPPAFFRDIPPFIRGLCFIDYIYVQNLLIFPESDTDAILNITLKKKEVNQ